MNIYKKILDFFIKLFNVLLVCFVGGIVLLMLNELIMRNIFNKSFQGMTELAGFFFLWMAFLGIPVLFNNNGLITLDIVYTHVNNKLKTIFWYIQQFVVIGLGIVMIIAFIGLYPFIATEFYSSMPGFSKMWQFLPIAVCGAFLASKALYNILEKSLKLKKE